MRLRILRRLNNRIGLQEAPDHSVVEATIHVNDAQLRKVLMPREAALVAVEARSCITPRSKAEHGERAIGGGRSAARRDRELGDHAAQMIFQEQLGHRVGAREVRGVGLVDRLPRGRIKVGSDRGDHTIRAADGGEAADHLAADVAMHFEAAGDKSRP